MRGKSKLNNARIAVLLLALLVGLSPVPSLAATAAADVEEISLLPAT